MLDSLQYLVPSEELLRLPSSLSDLIHIVNGDKNDDGLDFYHYYVFIRLRRANMWRPLFHPNDVWWVWAENDLTLSIHASLNAKYSLCSIKCRYFYSISLIIDNNSTVVKDSALTLSFHLGM